MAEEAKTEQVKPNIDMEALTPKGRLHAEQYQKLQMQRVVHQLEIEKIDVLMKYYEQTIPKEILEKKPEEEAKDDK